jgi:transcriptional regulator with XRE-family HTH domain
LNGLRLARATKGFTVSELSRRSGLGRDTIGKIERGLHAPQPKTLHKLAVALEMNPVELAEMMAQGDAAPKDQAPPEPMSLPWALNSPDEDFYPAVDGAPVEARRKLADELYRRLLRVNALARDARRGGRHDEREFLIRNLRWLDARFGHAFIAALAEHRDEGGEWPSLFEAVRNASEEIGEEIGEADELAHGRDATSR